MKNLSFKNFNCDDLISAFGEKDLEERYNALFAEAQKFIEVNELAEKAVVNRVILANVVIDYCSDIKRLKDFHTDVKKTNSQKVMAYSAWWFLYRKPIQIIDINVDNKDIATINERFIAQYILNYLSERERGTHILLRDNIGLKNFVKFLLYYLIYRASSARCLEMIITAFLAGQIYEQTNEDISDLLHPFDVRDVNNILSN